MESLKMIVSSLGRWSIKTLLPLTFVWVIGFYGLSVSWAMLVAIAIFFGSYYIKEQAKEDTSSSIPRVLGSPDSNQAAWLTEVFLRLWPHTKARVEDFMRTQLQQSVRKQLPSTLQTFTLTDIKLGSQVPKVLAVAVKESSTDCVTLDIEILYHSDADIGFTIGRLSSSIKSIQAHGTLRVVLTDLCSIWPFFGNINISFLTEPAFTFRLSKSASIFNTVGFRDIIHESVVNQLNKIFVLPNFLTVPVDPSSASVAQYPLAQGVLRLVIHSAKGLVLEQKDYVDPYCTVQVGANRCRSGVLQKTTHPKWNEVFEFIVDDKERQYVEIECVDAADTASSGSLGVCCLSLASVLSADGGIVTVPLEKTEGGCINVSAVWMELSSHNSDQQRVKQVTYGCKALSSAVLSVGVHSAKDLPKGMRSIRPPSCYVRLCLANDEQQTSVVQTSDKPVWREHFYFLVGEISKEDLQLEVIDDLTDTCLGKMAVTLADLLSITDTADQWHTLHSYNGSQASICLALRLKVLTGNNLKPLRQPSPEPRPVPTPEMINGEITPLNAEFPVSSTPSKVQLLKRQITSPVPDKSENGSSDEQSDILDFDNWSELESNVIAGGSTYIVISRPDGSTVSEIVQNPPTADDTLSSNTGKPDPEDAMVGKTQITLRYSSAQQKLMIVVHQCCNLSPVDKENAPDPFVVLTLYNNKTKVDRKKTKHHRSTVNPVFDETFEFKLPQAVLNNAVVEMRIKNRRGLFQKGKGDMGSVLLNIQALDLSEARTDWFLIRRLKSSTESLPNKSQNKSLLSRTQSMIK